MIEKRVISSSSAERPFLLFRERIISIRRGRKVTAVFRVASLTTCIGAAPGPIYKAACEIKNLYICDPELVFRLTPL